MMKLINDLIDGNIGDLLKLAVAQNVKLEKTCWPYLWTELGTVGENNARCGPVG